ncbi:MAG: GtrA family protein [Eubacteriales bacterium]|nr:GtrA family protein [Eubacteriales bacterium]
MIDMIVGLMKKYKEVILYLVFGVLSMIISIGTFSAFVYVMHMDALIANILSWIITIIVVYFTNKKWVFESETNGKKEGLKEFISFVVGRLATLGLEELVLLVGIKWMGLSSFWVKIVAQVLVVVSNYVISKFIVFKKK